jgi:type IV secretion system protein VirB1
MRLLRGTAEGKLPDFLIVALACAPLVAPTTMAALVRAESGFYPWAIGVNNAAPLAREPHSLDEAKATARALLAQGRNLDLGLAQINSANLPWLGLTIDTVFEPCRNIHGAAIVLRACYERASARFGKGQRALQAALSCYNTNSLSRGFTNGYVQKVVAASTEIVPAIDPHYPVPPAPAKRGAVVLEPARTPRSPAPRPAITRSHGVTVIRGGAGG